ncbi:hypothetical protein L9F63_014091, partial [Diploptera punctata]
GWKTNDDIFYLISSNFKILCAVSGYPFMILEHKSLSFLMARFIRRLYSQVIC